MNDTYSFECDLDRNRPAAARAALTVSSDGEHFVFNMSTSALDAGREVYLTPDAAGNLAHLVDALRGVDSEPEPEVLTSTIMVVWIVVVALVFGIGYPLLELLAR